MDKETGKTPRSRAVMALPGTNMDQCMLLINHKLLLDRNDAERTAANGFPPPMSRPTAMVTLLHLYHTVQTQPVYG